MNVAANTIEYGLDKLNIPPLNITVFHKKALSEKRKMSPDVVHMVREVNLMDLTSQVHGTKETVRSNKITRELITKTRASTHKIEVSPLTPEEFEAKEKALKILEQEEVKRKKRESIDLFPERYTKEDEAQIAYKKLSKQGILKDEFGQIYFGWFKSKDAFAFMRLHGSNGLCKAHVDYRDHSDAIFKDQFLFENGHVFWK